MSQTSSRPPSESNHRAYWFAYAYAPQQVAAINANNIKDDEDCSEQSTNNNNSDIPVKEQREQQFFNNNNNYPNMAYKGTNYKQYNTVISPNCATNTTIATIATTPQSDTYWFAHTGVEPVVALSPETDGKTDGLKFDEKLRLCRERQEDERHRRLLEIELSSQQKQRYREQIEEERRRKIDELKVRDLEKRSAVEERKKLIWEAEQDRKEAMLRRSLDRDNKMEAKRLAQRNASSFVFGSSTPRTIDLDLPALGTNKQSHSLLFSATPNRTNASDETLSNGNSRRRPISAYFADDYTISNTKELSNSQTSPLSAINMRDNYIYRSALYSEQAKACLTMNEIYDSGHDFNPLNGTISSAADENIMSQSLVSLTAGISRGRKRHTELTPAMPRERIFASSTSRINKESNNKGGINEVKSTPKRAVSMTRLDQLAQPRRRYVDDNLKSLNSITGNTNSLTNCNSIAKSMSNLSNNNKTNAIARQSTFRKGMFKSMTQLCNQRTKTSPTNNNIVQKSPNYSSFCNTNKEKSKSMVHLSAKPPPPRQTRASKLRTETSLRSTKSSLTLNDDSNDFNSKESTFSPMRPLSSMSGTSENTEAVKRRVKPAVPRKPRPLSIGSAYLEKKLENKDILVDNRGSRTTEKQIHPTPTLRSNRARSAGASPRQLSLASPDIESNNITSVSPKPMPPRKPAHVKAAAMARKANKQSEPDNDQKEVKNNKTNSDADKKSEEVVPSIEPKQSPNTESDSCMPSMPSINSNNKKEISEDDYKKMMAEKRKQAREQAEREAELERIRLENEKLAEVERLRREEEEQKRLEEEQLKLLEEQKLREDERLRKAMEETRLREEEEYKKREEEIRLKNEKEEKDKKAKEEAERLRLELEERLKRDEEERLARKKKLEAIMSRTRKTTTMIGSSQSNSPNETPEPQLSDSNGSTPEKTREEAKNHQNILMNEQKDDELVIITNSDKTSTLPITQLKPDLVEDVNRAVLQNRKDQISAMNGSHNSNHIENFRPEDRLNPAVDNLLDFNGLSSVTSRSPQEVSASLEQLINLNYSTPNNTDDMNSNHVTSNPFIPTTGVKSPEQTITDLLS